MLAPMRRILSAQKADLSAETSMLPALRLTLPSAAWLCCGPLGAKQVIPSAGGASQAVAGKMREN